MSGKFLIQSDIMVEFRLNDIGTVITVIIKDSSGTIVDVSSATVTKNIVLKKPDGTIETKGASFTTNGTDGSIYYTTISGDLNTLGT